MHRSGKVEHMSSSAPHEINIDPIVGQVILSTLLGMYRMLRVLLITKHNQRVKQGKQTFFSTILFVPGKSTTFSRASHPWSTRSIPVYSALNHAH